MCEFFSPPPPSSQRDFNKVFINIVQKFSSTFPADLRRTHCTVQYIYIINNEKIESPAQTDPVCFWTAREKFLLNYKWRFYYTFSNEIANKTVELFFDNFCFIDSANYLCVFFSVFPLLHSTVYCRLNFSNIIAWIFITKTVQIIIIKHYYIYNIIK